MLQTPLLHSIIIKYHLLLWLFIMAGLVLFNSTGYSQHLKSSQIIAPLHVKRDMKIDDSTCLSFSYQQNACKYSNWFLQFNHLQRVVWTRTRRQSALDENSKNDFIHGDITYDYFYRSAIDTPFAGNNIQQHNTRVNTQLLFAKQFPVVVQVNSRQTNSYLFKNYTDVNVQFNNKVYNTAARDKLAKEIVRKIAEASPDNILLINFNNQQRLLEESKQWLEDARQLQQLTESRHLLSQAEEQIKERRLVEEDDIINAASDSIKTKIGQPQLNGYKQKISQLPARFLYTKINSTDAIRRFVETNKQVQQQRLMDSLKNKKEIAARFIAIYREKEAQYDKYKKKADSLQQAYKAAKEKTQQKIAEIKNTFETSSAAEVTKKVKEYKLDSSAVFKWYKRINAVQQLSVGRSMVDYSELSAKNISITGLQVVYQSKLYIAFATGGVDYRYRDFILRNYTPVKQYLNLFRLGIGTQETNNLIVTLYQGKKQANYFLANNQPGINRVFGVTLQGAFRLNENNYLVAEAAKSSYPQIAATNANAAGNGVNKTFNFSNHSNEAYSVKLFSRIAATDTRIHIQYKYLGRNFQSFSLFNVNNSLLFAIISLNLPLIIK